MKIATMASGIHYFLRLTACTIGSPASRTIFDGQVSLGTYILGGIVRATVS
jgi:hypothetical protein